MSNESVSEEIVEDILDNLKGRGGIGDELYQIKSSSPDIYENMNVDLVKLVEDKLDSID